MQPAVIRRISNSDAAVVTDPGKMRSIFRKTDTMDPASCPRTP